MGRLTVAVFLVLFAVVVTAKRHPALPTFLLGRPSGGFMRDGYRHFSGDYEPEKTLDDYPGLQRLNFTQKLDHTKDDGLTFQQRYWYNPNFTQKKNIIFLLLQGESIATDTWAGNPGYTYLRLAEIYGADAFQLEHRCFGYSRPYPDLTTEHLKICTMSQAIEDIADFIKGMNDQYGFVKPKWVTFGGSYPGTLNALFRAKYPDLTVGAIASSAPLYLKLDFYEYAQVVENGLRTTDPSCAQAVDSAFKKMQQLSLSNEGRRQLNGYFNLQPPFQDDKTTQLDIDNFFANLYSVFQGVTQYTYDGRNNMTINGLGLKELCKQMTKEQFDVITRVNNTVNWVNSYYGGAMPFPNSYSDMMSALSNTTFDDEDPFQDNAANRGWMWLSCNELGFLQTTDQGRNVFQQTVPLNYFIDMCTGMFGDEVNIKYIRDHNLAAQNRWKGADGYQATNIVLPNGSYDPWHALGRIDRPVDDAHLVPILINGTAHCADMYPIYAGEPTGLRNARLVIEKELKYYLGVI
ncbi:unnamed protein product, partial [Mesorhabditis spiculigera]